METVTVKASKTYDIIIGSGLLANAPQYLSPIIQDGAAMIVSDDRVYPLYGKKLLADLQSCGIKTSSFVFPNGEFSKNADTYIALLDALAENGMTRTDTVIALGGGVTGDMAGFAAATYMRGINFVQVPTTLLAAVDSSVGGKTAIDLKAGKNLAGVFYQPGLVLCDIQTFETLDSSVFNDGIAEIIKHVILADGELKQLLAAPVKHNLETIVAHNVRIKRDIVEADEREMGRRKLLNLGHTVGHSLEILSDFQLTHGQAVAIGTCVMARICAKSGVCPQSLADEIIALFKFHGLPTETSFTAQQIADIAKLDKKRKSNDITLIWIENFGRCVLRDIRMDAYEQLLRLALPQ